MKNITCFKCQKEGHYQSQFPENVNKSKDQANNAVIEDLENGVWWIRIEGVCRI